MERRWQTVPLRHLDRGRHNANVHTAWWDGPASGPVFVCVHGLGGSHVNWSLLGPQLARHGAVWAPDLAGFGLTPPAGRRPTISDNLDLVVGFIRTVSPDRPVIVVGNSMGGIITLLLAAARPRLVAGAVLVAPASPRPLNAPVDREVVTNFAMLMAPFVGERVLAYRQRRTTPEEQVRQTLMLSAADPDNLDRAVVAEHVELARRRREFPYARTALLQATRSLLLLTGPGAARVWQAVADVQAPTLVLHGTKDRLVTAAGMAAMARRRRDWTFVTYDGVGHIPMLETPDRVADDIESWMDQYAGEPAPH